MNIKVVIFDLDGVIVSTDEYHFRGWEEMADEEGIYFDREINERLRGVSRMESLEIILERTCKQYTEKEKIELAERKNYYYRQLLNDLSPKDILPGVTEVLKELKEKGIKIAIGSSSKNTPMILNKIGLEDCFDAVADGNGIKNSKPDPEVFLLAASKLNINPESCLVVEDADAGIEAALAGGMRVLGVGTASMNEKATYKAKDLSETNLEEVLG
jgi:beta-phosphoglucomutase